MKLSAIAVISAFVAVTSAATTPVSLGTTVQSIMNDLTQIGAQFQAIDTLLNGFPANGVDAANEIHEHDAQNHVLFVQINDNLGLLPSPVPEADVKKIVAAYNAFTPTIIDTLTQIATKAPDFESIGVAPTIQNDLILSDASCKNFRILVEGMTPPFMSAAVTNMFTSIDTARDNAIAAFSS
ncbi:hypothetical protein CVT26_015530 [Gymnopilus dilepis]|uniref:Hydrophobic surface binding protein n=1 Tax=Gymnopilus dilepis TaxID=231916 RepID=A0A409YD36_9AGAR|nr:hypothetical protein CVT26_015530 [Gymnopilus dilepis]